MAEPDDATMDPPIPPRLKPLPDQLPEVEKFFRSDYRDLLRYAMYVGATKQQAEDAIMATVDETLRRWTEIENPSSFARKAVISNFLKEKERGLERVRRRQIERGNVVPEGQRDPDLTAWEDRQWVTQMLRSLPPAQREVMAFVVDDFRPAEIAQLLGKTPEAIRQNLHDARRCLRKLLGQKRTLPGEV